MTVINFNDLSRGTVVDNEYSAQGVTISASGGSGDAMIFDTANPTGGDHDLATSNLDGVLIVSEDGDSNDPDDNASGGTLSFAFDDETSVESLTFLDNEEGATVKFYDEQGNVISEQFVDGTGNNSQYVAHFNVQGVYRMDVHMPNSGAIDNLVFESNTDTLDGTVEGTSGDDMIDVNYTGDPDGDMVDNNDAILAGDTGDDDLIIAGGGDDLVLAGDGNDEVYGGTGDDTLCGQDGDDTLFGGAGNDFLEGMNGNDTVFGGAGDDRVKGDAGDDTLNGGSGDDSITGGSGNDVIYGDANGQDETGTTVRESFSWADRSDNEIDHGYSVDTGNVIVTYDRTQDTGGHNSSLSDDTLNTTGINAGGQTVDGNNSLESVTNGEGNEGTFSWDFSAPVENVSFNINDIDGDGVVRVTAFDMDGNPIDVVLTGGNGLTLLDTDTVAGADTADSNGGYNATNSATYNLNVTIPGPVSSIIVEHDQNGDNNSGIHITEIFFDTTDAPADGSGVDGNDVIAGGTGDDLIFGGGGDDTISGGADNDTVHGGTGDDDIAGNSGDDFLLGGDGDDNIDGGTGDDTLCGQDGDDTLFGGAGNDILEGMNDDDVMFGGAGDDSIYGDAGDDYAEGGAGNDIMLGGSGDDTLLGNAGDDDINGGTGNDVLYGDDIIAAPGINLLVNGSFEAGVANNSTAYNGTVNGWQSSTGNIEVWADGFLGVNGTDGSNFVELDRGAELDSIWQDVPTQAGHTYEISVDALQRGSDTDSVEILWNGDIVAVVVPSAGTNWDTFTVQVTGTGGSDRLEFRELDSENDRTSPLLDNVTLVDLSDNVGGNDTIDGGDGDDVIYGQVGDDTLTGGTGDDSIFGGADRDLINGGAGDTVDGGAAGDDYDILDVTGQGAFILTGPSGTGAPIPDSNGNGFDGQIIFVDADGVPTGEVIDFVEIEEIRGEQTNAGPIATDDTFTSTEDDASQIMGNVITGDTGNGVDTDPDGDTLTVGAVNGDPAGVGAAVAADNGGLVTINADGTVSFDPDGAFEALDDGEEATTTVTYTVTDSDGASSTATVSFTVTGVNDGPVAVDNAYTVTKFETADDVDGNVITDDSGDGIDSDAEGDTLTVVAVGGVASGVGTAVAGDNGGTFTINADGTVDFDANGDFDTLGLGATADTSVTYTIVDEAGNEDTATATFTVTGINDGTVQGTAGNDIINPDIPYVDADGDIVDANDAILPGDVGNDDLIMGFGGDDSIDAGTGDDVVFGGTGNDTIAGGTGNDVLMGNDGDDVITGGAGDDMIFGAQGDDSLAGNAGNDKIEGSAGDDTIRGGDGEDDLWGGEDDDTVFGGDDNDTVAGGAGNDTLDGGQGDDIVLGEDGDDSINGGQGDDTIDGGIGDDSIAGGTGNDVIEGGDGNDTINAGNHIDPATDYDYPGATIPGLPIGDNDPFPNNDLDTVFGGAGDDVIFTGDDDDFIDGGTGNDFIDAGIDDDSVRGGDGNDTIIGGQGEDIITGDDGDDLIYGGLVSEVLDLPDAFDPAPDDNRDTIFGGNGNDTIFGRDDNDTLFGGIGNDILDGGIDDDEIWGGDGDDTIFGGQGNDVINGGAGQDLVFGGLGDDTIQGNQDDDAIYGDEGNDTITGSLDDDLVFGGADDDDIRGGTGDDTLLGDDGDDYIQGGFGDDSIYGGTGDDSLNGGFGADIVEGGDGNDTVAGYDGEDTITGGAGEDVLYGGLNSDIFFGGNGGDVVKGGEDPDDSDVDVLDLTGSNVDFITYVDGDPEAGTVTFLDGTTMTFSEIENVIPCFTPGTTIATAKGERLVEELVEGDRIITRDNGIQEIAWVGHKMMTGKQLVQNPHLRPILIKTGALGNGLPERDMMVSPNHRVLVASNLTQLYFEENEVLAAAKHMVGSNGIHAVDVISTTYVHFMFQRHEVVLSNGAWTESFQPGDYSLKGIGNSQRNEIMELFPELNTKSGLEGYQSARKALKKHEAKLLLK